MSGDALHVEIPFGAEQANKKIKKLLSGKKKTQNIQPYLSDSDGGGDSMGGRVANQSQEQNRGLKSSADEKESQPMKVASQFISILKMLSPLSHPSGLYTSGATLKIASLRERLFL